MSVFDALKADELNNPTEVSLIMMLSAIKEALLAHTLSKLHWCDTRDMASDGLNKGAVSRAGLLAIANEGVWTLLHASKSHSEHRYEPIQSVKAMIQEELQSGRPQ